MSVGTPSNADLLELPPLPVRRFTVAEYRQMIQSGIIDEDDNVELLEGWLVLKMGRNAPHDLALGLLEDELMLRLPAGWIRRGQSAVTTTDSEPEPDIAIVRGPRRKYNDQQPRPSDTGLVVEIAESSLRRDQTIKQRIYSRSGVPVYWIVNLQDMQVEVYTMPTKRGGAPHYRKHDDYKPGQSVPLILDGKEIARIPVRDLLP